MSLVRYSPNDSRSVILRHQQTLVLYDHSSRQIVLREASPSATVEANAGLSTCPYCKRPLHHEDDSDSDVPPTSALPAGQHRSRAGTPLAESGFVDRDYFRMLESTVPLEDGASPAQTVPTQIPRLKAEDTIESVEDEEASVAHPSEGINAAAFSPGYFSRFFVTERELGRGGKGVVLLVRHVLDGVPLGNFACKRVPVGDNHAWLKKVLLEVQLLQRLSHQNLVSYRHVWLENVQLSTFGPNVPCAFILQQYCNSGDLHNYVLNPSKPTTKEQLKERLRRRSRGQPDILERLPQPKWLPFDQIVSFFRDIAAGLNHLHCNGFIHRDLKPSNCLLHDPQLPGQRMRCLVSDFGEVQQENQIRRSTGNTGTISYCAPEVLRQEPPGGKYGNFTTKSDVFSLGMILHFMCFGRLPYAGSDALHEENEDLEALRAEITAWKGLDSTAELRSDLPERLYQSLKTLISPDPSVRPSAEDILLKLEKGIGDEATQMRRNSSASQHGSAQSSAIDDTSFHRISPVADTPPPGTPIRAGSSAHFNGNQKVRSRSPADDTPHKEVRKTSLLGAEPSLPPPSPTVEDLPESTESLIVHPMRSPIAPAFPLSQPQRPQMLWPRTAVKLTGFFLKVAMLSQPCAPVMIRPWIYYPLMGLAAIDFAM